MTNEIPIQRSKSGAAKKRAKLATPLNPKKLLKAIKNDSKAAETASGILIGNRSDSSSARHKAKTVYQPMKIQIRLVEIMREPQLPKTDRESTE